MKIVFVSNYVPHYRVGLFEYLQKKLDIEFLFFSKGEEWYWPKQHGIYTGNFSYKYLTGFRIGNTAINFSLIKELLLNQYDVFIKCINGRFALPATYLIARLKGKPFILWTGIWMRIDSPFHRLLFPITRFIYTHSDAVVVYGNHVKQFLINIGVNEDRIFIASQAVNNETYSKIVSSEEKAQLLANLNIPENSKVILYIGRLVESKGLSSIITAFSKVKNKSNLFLVLAGDGQEKIHLMELVNHLHLGDFVRFTGHVRTSETVPYYSISHISILNSVTTKMDKEPWGLTINESFNQRVPVIVSDAVGAAADGFVNNGVNGIIIPENDIGALTLAIEKLVTDNGFRNSLGQNALETVKKQDYERMGSGFLQALNYVTSINRKNNPINRSSL